MDWKQATIEIRRTLRIGVHLDPDSPYRYVVAADAATQSKRYGYKGEAAFVVTIGKTDKVKIPWSMLKECFDALNSPGGYSGRFFQERFPLQHSDHSCHVHVVGQIFRAAGLADKIGIAPNKYKWLPCRHTT